MKRITLSLSLLPLLLSSCSNQKSFGNWKNDDLPYLDRNGDNAIANKWTSVNDLTITVEGEDLIPIVERGESFFLCFSRETCSHCQAISEQMISFLEKSDLAIYRNEMATISSFRRRSHPDLQPLRNPDFLLCGIRQSKAESHLFPRRQRRKRLLRLLPREVQPHGDLPFLRGKEPRWFFEQKRGSPLIF